MGTPSNTLESLCFTPTVVDRKRSQSERGSLKGLQLSSGGAQLSRTERFSCTKGLNRSRDLLGEDGLAQAKTRHRSEADLGTLLAPKKCLLFSRFSSQTTQMTQEHKKHQKALQWGWSLFVPLTTITCKQKELTTDSTSSSQDPGAAIVPRQP